MRSTKLSTILYTSITGLLVFSILAMTFLNLKTTNTLVEQSEVLSMTNLMKSANQELQAEGRLATAMAALVAKKPSTITALSQQERTILENEYVAGFANMNDQFGVRQFQFHLPPATSFFRVHKPAKYGDDLSGFRKTVLHVNESSKPASGLEVGVASLGMRGVFPVKNGNEHIGSIEFGMSFGQRFFDSFKAKYDAEIALVLKREGKFDIFATTQQNSALASTERIKDVFNQQKSIIWQTTLNEVEHAIIADIVKNFSGEPIGVLIVASNRTEQLETLSDNRTSIIVLALVLLAIGIGASQIICRRILKPINKTVELMNEIATGEGDLTRRLPTKGPQEIARLASAFNQFVETVQQIVNEIKETTKTVSGVVASINEITHKTDSGVQQQLAEIDQIATAMNEMSVTAVNVAENASGAAKDAIAVSDNAQQSKYSVEKTTATITSVDSYLNDAQSVMERLVTESNNIGNVLDVIKSIAEQTNLLALNAAIEAARAGDMGRGFAVVADEVRTLAQRSHDSTQEIQHIIEQLQTGANESANVMQNSASQASSCVQDADKALSTLEKIQLDIQNINNRNTEMAAAAEEQSAVSEDINRNIQNVFNIAQSVADDSSDVLKEQQRMIELANNLNHVVTRFKS